MCYICTKLLHTAKNLNNVKNHDDYEKMTIFEAVYLDVKRPDLFLVCP